MMPDMPDPERLRKAVNSFLVASSEKRSDQPDMPYVEIMGPSLDDVAFVLDAARFLLSVLDEGGRLEVVVPCEREGGIIHERADGSECPYYGHHVCDKCGWIDPEHKGEYVSCGERTVVWPTPAFKFHDCIGTFGAPCPGCAGG